MIKMLRKVTPCVLSTILAFATFSPVRAAKSESESKESTQIIYQKRLSEKQQNPEKLKETVQEKRGKSLKGVSGQKKNLKKAGNLYATFEVEYKGHIFNYYFYDMDTQSPYAEVDFQSSDPLDIVEFPSKAEYTKNNPDHPEFTGRFYEVTRADIYGEVKEAVVPEGVKKVFINAKTAKVDSITIPSTATDIDIPSYYTLSYNSSEAKPAALKEIKMSNAEQSKNFSVKAGVLYNKDMTQIVACPTNLNQETFTIPDTVKEIPDHIFRANQTIKNIVMGDSVNTIGAYTFSDSNIEAVTMGNGVKVLGECSFADAKNLKKVRLSANSDFTTLDDNTFYRTKNLKEIELPENIRVLTRYVFAGSGIQSIDLSRIKKTGVGVLGGTDASNFVGCIDLNTVYIGRDTKINDQDDFRLTPNLEKFVEKEPNEHDLFIKDDALYTKYYESMWETPMSYYGNVLLCYPSKKMDSRAKTNGGIFRVPDFTQRLAIGAIELNYYTDNTKKIIVPASVNMISGLSIQKRSYQNLEINFLSNQLPKFEYLSISGLDSSYNESIGSLKMNFKNESLKNEFLRLNQGKGDHPYVVIDNENEPVSYGVLPSVATQSLTLDQTKLLFNAFDSNQKLTYQLNPEDTTDIQTFKSSDPSVVTVSNDGTVTPKSYGIATVTVQSGNVKQECKVNFIPPENNKFWVNVKTAGSIAPSETGWANNHGLVVFPYTGKAITPKVDVYYGGVYLKEGRDYRLEYENNVNQTQKASAIIKVIGLSEEMQSVIENPRVEFGIEQKAAPKPIPTPTPKPTPQKPKITYVSSPSKATYSGKALKKSLTVKSGSKKLTNGKDYTITYSGNKNCGRAKMTIKGKGNYTGSYTRYFYIYPKKSSLKKLKAGKKKLTVYLKKSSGGVTGYQIRYSLKKNFKGSKYKTSKKTTYTIKSLKKKKYYYVKVRAYKTVGGKKIYGSWSAYKKVKTK